MKYALYTLLAAILLTACGNNANNTNATGTDTTEHASENAPMPAMYYKRYTGTIAGQPVVLYLHRYGSEVHGSYFYQKQGKNIQLYSWEDTVKATDAYYLTEWVTTERDEEMAHWQIRAVGNKLEGEWISEDGKKRHPIALQEAYEPINSKLDVLYVVDSMSAADGRKTPQATNTYQTLVPGKNVDEKVNAFLFAELELSTGGFTANIKKQQAAYFANYRKDMQGMSEEELQSETNNYYEGSNNWVVYNENNWLIIRKFSDTYMGGAHGISGSSYLNLDLQTQKHWHLADVIQGDTAKLKPLLNESAQAYFKKPNQTELAETVFQYPIPPTDNFYIMPAGLVFVYNPYHIASYADGEVNLFIPFSKLAPYLTPAFKQRMGL